MNYLKITNDGLIVKEDLYLIGSSTKRGDTNKIGMFGSGWKYALAWLLRNEIDIKVFSGKKRINIGTNVIIHRDTPTRIITVEGKETSITTSMGPKWTGWMAIRELVSNAIDEGQETVNTCFNPDSFKGEVERTVIYIEMNKELLDVMRDYDKYFAFEKTPDFVTRDRHRIFYRESDGPVNIYRKGIRCLDTDKSALIDFDFFDIEINESRLIQESDMNKIVRKMFKSDEELPVKLIVQLLKSNYTYWLPSNDWNDNILSRCNDLLNAGYTLTTAYTVALGGDWAIMEKDTTLLIPGKWYSQLSRLGLVESPFSGLGSGTPEDFIQTDEVNVYPIKEILAKVNLDHLEIHSGTWNSLWTDIFECNGVYYVKDFGEGKDKDYLAKAVDIVSEISNAQWKEELSKP